MQDRYTGDIGDFGKYGLLRVLAAPETGEEKKLGVVWYLTPDQTQTRDGRHTGYLQLNERGRSPFTACDENLYLALQELVNTGKRSVAALQDSGVLPEGTTYHSDELDLRNRGKEPGKTLRQTREKERSRWNDAALEKTENCELVFLDPDNGLETGNVKPHEIRGTKYAFYTELVPYLRREQSLVLYHHLNRRNRSIRQVHRKQREIYERLGRRAFAMRYHRGSPRAFIVIPQDRHRREFMAQTRRMLAGPWGKHFTMIG